MRSIKRYIIPLAAVLLAVSAAVFFFCRHSGGSPSPEVPTLSSCPLEHETEFGGIYIKTSIDDFNSLGFEYGDSVDIVFSNGYSMTDIPYYNGYYANIGDPLLVAYPGSKYIKAAVNFGDDLWNTADSVGDGFSEDSCADITLNEKAKYLGIQSIWDISYSDDRTGFPSDVVFANFRQFSMGSIAPGKLYRSASPCDNKHGRAPFVDSLASSEGIKCILDLADSDEKIKGYIEADDFDSPYFLSLYDSGNVIPIALTANYRSDDYAARIAGGFRQMTANEGPFLIHCTEGKDRTGFVCMLIQALAGAGYDEMAEDYMITYDNYYKITAGKDPDKYALILENNFETMLLFLAGDPGADLKNTDFAPCARKYLIRAGMTEAEIDAFLDHISS